jgi:hypothetical protein
VYLYVLIYVNLSSIAELHQFHASPVPGTIPCSSGVGLSKKVEDEAKFPKANKFFVIF